jgi:histidinol-phosphate aminotransferase
VSKLDRLQRLELLTLPAPDPGGPAVEVQLDVPERPVDWPADLKAAWAAAFTKLDWNRRPPGQLDLRRAIADQVGLTSEHVALGAGPEALLAAMIAAWAQRATVVYPVPTSPAWARVAVAMGATPVAVMSKADFSLPVEQLVAVAKQQQAALVLLGSPQDPTGSLVSRDEVLTIVRETDALVLVDETLAAYAGFSVADAVADFDNLAVLQGPAHFGRSEAFRLAWLLAHPRVIETLARMPLADAVSAPAILAGHFALVHRERLAPAISEVATAREALRAGLAGIRDVVTWPSVADFLLVGTTLGSEDLARRLLDRGVAVRSFDKSPLMNCVRVTVGTQAENAALLEALTDVFGLVT